MNMEEIQKNANKLLENFYNNKFKSALHIVMIYCIEDVGLNKQNLIEKVTEMSNLDELKKLSEKSFINKQILKQFLILEDESRIKIFDELIHQLEKYEEKNGEICITENTKIQEKKLRFKTKNKNIVLKLLSGYKEENDDEFDFCAKYGEDLNIKMCSFQYLSHSFLLGDKDKIYKEEHRNEILEKYVEQISKYNDNLKTLKYHQNQKIKKQEIVGLCHMFSEKDIATIELEGINKNTSEKRTYLISAIKFSGEIFKDKVFLIVMIQSCKVDNYNTYKDIIEENYKDNIFYEPEDVTEYLEIEIGDPKINKIKLEIQNNEAIISQPEIKFGDEKISETKIIFDYRGCGYNSIKEFKENITGFVYVFKGILNKQQKILESLYMSALEFYISWEEIEDANIEYVKAHTKISCIEIYNDMAIIKASGFDNDNEESLLGGHFIEALVKAEELDSDDLILKWNLS